MAPVLLFISGLTDHLLCCLSKKLFLQSSLVTITGHWRSCLNQGVVFANSLQRNLIFESLNVMKLHQRLILSVGLAMLSLTTISPVIAQGPGTEMTEIINRWGLGSDCSRCKALAAEMDYRGADWVLQNRQYVANRTIDNASNLGHNICLLYTSPSPRDRG